MLSKVRVSKLIILATGLAFLVFIRIGVDNFSNWKFVMSLFGLLGFVLLLIFDIIIRNNKHK